MRVFGLSLALFALATAQSIAAPGDQWILGIHHIDNQGDKPFTTYAGTGYSGTQSSGAAQYIGNSYGFSGTGVGINRVWWELSGNSTNNGTPVPSSTELYSISFFGANDGGHNSWQPVEGQINGIVGDHAFNEPNIPWYQESGTNHQYMAASGADDRNWHALGPGPHTPSGPAFNASGNNGTYMWLKPGSWLYAKWDFTFAIDRSWSALRLTQITPLAGPPVSGDYNKNGVVDAADYVLWRKTYGQQGANLATDGFPDGFIDEYDYDWWAERFGNSNGSGSGSGLLSAVPEPTTFALAGFVACVCVVASRRRRPCVGL